MLELGNFIPDFTAPDQDGNIVSSAELLGKKTVVYFYPKASTPGCTAEACSLRDKNGMPSMKKSNQLRLTFFSWERLAKS